MEGFALLCCLAELGFCVFGFLLFFLEVRDEDWFGLGFLQTQKCNDCVNSGTTSKHTDTENPHRIETDKTICSKKELLIQPCCYWWRIWETL
jgi:hypothetical protein